MPIPKNTVIPVLDDDRPLAERLLDAAEAEIVERGTTDVTLRAVARRIGVSHQAPGYVFTDRAGLMTALSVRGYQMLNQSINATRKRCRENNSGRETLVEMGVSYVIAASNRPALFWLVSRPDLGGNSKELKNARGKAVATLLDAVRAAMKDGWHQGGSPRTLAALCWSTVHGLAVLHGEPLEQLTEESLEETARSVLNTLLA